MIPYKKESPYEKYYPIILLALILLLGLFFNFGEHFKYKTLLKPDADFISHIKSSFAVKGITSFKTEYDSVFNESKSINGLIINIVTIDNKEYKYIKEFNNAHVFSIAFNDNKVLVLANIHPADKNISFNKYQENLKLIIDDTLKAHFQSLELANNWAKHSKEIEK